MSEHVQPHPISEALPAMSEEEYEELVADIQENGLRDKIIIHEGKILDGRHRARALEELGIPIDADTAEEYDQELHGDPAKYVLSVNLRRRHNLTAGQRAGIALNLMKHVAGSVRKNKGGRPAKVEDDQGFCDTDIPVDQPRRSSPRAKENLPPIGGEFPKTMKEIAQETGASVRSIERFKALETKNPELAEEVKRGAKTLNQAEVELDPDAKPRSPSDIVLERLAVLATNSPTGAVWFNRVGGITFVVAADAETRAKLLALVQAGKWSRIKFADD